MSANARTIFFRLFLCSLLVLAAERAFAQTTVDDVHITPRATPQEVEIASAAYPKADLQSGLIHASVNLVLVPVTITDDLNRPVVGLDQQNFQIFENKHPQEIKNFSSEDTPVSIGILVDSSGSMAYKLDRAREAIREFCDAANAQDEFFLITFADQPRLTTDFTTRSEEVINDLLTVRSKGETSLLDAIYMGIRKMRDARYARKALLVLSDGGDNHSRYTEHDVKSAIRESDVSVYAVGTYERWVSTQEELLGPELMRSLAATTGGQAYSLSNVSDMPAVAKNIGIRLRHQYLLAYTPQTAQRDGKWHKISVKLRLPKKFPFVRVEARPGYYAAGGE